MLIETIEQPVIDTARLTIRPLRRSDKGLLELYGGDQRVAHNICLPHPLPPGATDSFISQAMAGDRVEDVWALDGSKSGLPELTGAIGLERMDRQQSKIGYWVAPAFWNTGLATEAVEAMIAANPQGARTYFAWVFQDNPASARVLTNAGFDYLGDAEEYSLARGANFATWTYLRSLE